MKNQNFFASFVALIFALTFAACNKPADAPTPALDCSQNGAVLKFTSLPDGTLLTNPPPPAQITLNAYGNLDETVVQFGTCVSYYYPSASRYYLVEGTGHEVYPRSGHDLAGAIRSAMNSCKCGLN